MTNLIYYFTMVQFWGAVVLIFSTEIFDWTSDWLPIGIAFSMLMAGATAQWVDYQRSRFPRRLTSLDLAVYKLFYWWWAPILEQRPDLMHLFDWWHSERKRQEIQATRNN